MSDHPNTLPNTLPPNTLPTVRIGIMSFAHLHAEDYLPLLQRMPGVEVVGFSDTDSRRGAHFADAFGSRWYPSHEELLDEQPDAVIVCSENARHRELVEQAAAAGAQVLCEKPIEVTLEDAVAMRDACERHGVIFMTAFPMRFDPAVIAAREALARGDLGRLYAINGINHSECPKHHRAWFVDRELAGGGAVMDHTVHLLDLYRWLSGREPREVFAEVGNPFFPDELDVDTAGLVTVTFDDDLFAAIDCSWSRPPSYPRWGHLKFELFGERGALAVDAFAQHLDVWSAELPRTPSWLGWGANANEAMLAAFVRCVRTGEPPPVSWHDGYQALAVALACYRSAERGEPVTLGAS